MLGRRRHDPSRPDLREKLFGTSPFDVGLPPDGSRHVWGVLVDIATPTGLATLVSYVDGSTSLYSSSGSGVVGGGAFETVAMASEALVFAVESNFMVLNPTTETEPPRDGCTRFWALTYADRLMAEAANDDLEDRAHPLWRFNLGAHEVITALKLVT